ncbi:MAG: preprotein translocase subunit SecY [Alphaproteobacteria bacterium]|nr:preprotein translocase subunit SecY [Alphaproteobacteria bacterium]
MVSAAEQLARNINFSTFGKAKELQARIWFTLGALIVYRLGTHIPVPGVDPVQFAASFGAASQGILGMWNMFSGGAVERMAIFALNVMPYISASIIVQILTTAVPALERLKKEGEAGRKQLNQYTRYLTVILAIAQSSATAMALNAVDPATGASLAVDPGPYFLASTIITLVGGTIFLMWLGEQITARGVGNGISLIIFAGIVAELPRYAFQSLAQTRQGSLPIMALLAVIALTVALIVFIVFVERSQRRLLIQYPKRQQGNRMIGGESSFLPLKINTPGVIPPIFASSLLLLPNMFAGLSTATGGEADGWWASTLQFIQAYLGHGQPLFIILYAILIIFFCFFYTSIVFNPEETAENLRKYGGFIPGYRPGKRTAEHLDYVLTRLTVIGAAYITAVCVLPEILRGQFNGMFYIGGTSILIVVSVTMDTVAQIQSHLIGHQYEGMIKRSRLGGRRK